MERTSTRSSIPTILRTDHDGEYNPIVEPHLYGQLIKDYAQWSSTQTLYPGQIYNTLGKFLDQKSNHDPYKNDQNDAATIAYATLFSLAQATDSSSKDRDFQSFGDPSRCIEALESNVVSSTPQILFLRGHPSPEWITGIGAFCHVDPELFRWFLRYKELETDSYFFGAAPPSMSTVIRFKFFTIGSRNGREESCQTDVDKLRKTAKDGLHAYRGHLKQKRGLKQGDSIVRNFFVLDEKHCIIEQEISVSLFEIGNTWMALACTDAGNILSEGPPLPWFGEKACSFLSELFPYVQYRPQCALKARQVYDQLDTNKSQKNPQSLFLLSEGYRTVSDRSLSEMDPFSALSGIFKLSAFSQQQLLNILQRKISKETNLDSLNEENPTLANLLYIRDLIEMQLDQNLYMIQSIKRWHKFSPRSRRQNLKGQKLTGQKLPDSKLNKRIEESVHDLLRFYEDLYSQSKSLHKKCIHGMNVISNNAMLAESRRAIQQAQAVTKLTVMAFVYLPFTFMAGFFGMNFKEFGTGITSIWVFFATSIPLLIVSVCFFIFDANQIRKRLKKVGLKLKRMESQHNDEEKEDV